MPAARVPYACKAAKTAKNKEIFFSRIINHDSNGYAAAFLRRLRPPPFKRSFDYTYRAEQQSNGQFCPLEHAARN